VVKTAPNDARCANIFFLACFFLFTLTNVFLLLYLGSTNKIRVTMGKYEARDDKNGPKRRVPVVWVLGVNVCILYISFICFHY
jgi:hypothetical protein